MAAELRVGCSGYQYEHWRGVLYPQDLAKRYWFARYAEFFDTVEINNTFYSLPPAESFERWRLQAPPGFRLALKFSRFGTHMKRLKEAEGTIGLFLERAERLKSRLGPILVQLPPRWHADPERLRAFLRVAPRRHAFAVEFRDPSWLCDPVYEVLAEANAALVIHDHIPDHPARITAPFAYLRYHGRVQDGCYSQEQLAAEAQRIESWLEQGVAVWAFFNNDLGGHAVHNALDLRRMLQGAE